MLDQLSYQAKCELVVMWVGDKLIDDGYISMYMMLIHLNCRLKQIFSVWSLQLFALCK